MTSPYDIYKSTKEWQVINSAIQELIKNNDIEALTPNDYIVGYIVKQIIDNSNVENLNIEK